MKKEVQNLNKNLLKSVMVLHDDTQERLAEYLNISSGTLSLKINETNGAEFTQGEIKKIIERYDLTAEETDKIFFN